MAHLNDLDREFLLRLRREGVLETLSIENLVDHSKGAILVSCADGDQFGEVYQRHSELCCHHREAPRLHSLSLNGGAFCLPSKSPLNGGRGRVLIADIEGAIVLKGMPTLVLYGHAPCGAAGLANLSVEESLKLLVKAKIELKIQFEQRLKIALFFHVDWGHGKKRTYFVSATKWTELFK